jgi:diguanylate cyclase (GGDEF)-like protein
MTADSGAPQSVSGAFAACGPADVIADGARLAAGLCGAPVAVLGLCEGDRVEFPASVGCRPEAMSRSDPFVERILEAPGGRLRIADLGGASVSPPAGWDPSLRSLAAEVVGTGRGFVAVMDRRVRRFGPDHDEALRSLTGLLAAHLDFRAVLAGRSQSASPSGAGGSGGGPVTAPPRAAAIDAATGLPGREAFLDRLDEEIRDARETSRPVTVVLLDLDGFGALRTAEPGPVPDGVARSLAFVLEAEIRSADVVGRIGADEFALILPDTDVQGAYALVERLRRVVAGIRWADHVVTLSAGVAGAEGAEADAAALLAAAGGARRAARKAGRNRVAFRA